MFSITVRVPADPFLPVMGAPWDKHPRASTPGQSHQAGFQLLLEPLFQPFTNTDEDATGSEQKL